MSKTRTKRLDWNWCKQCGTKYMAARVTSKYCSPYHRLKAFRTKQDV